MSACSWRRSGRGSCYFGAVGDDADGALVRAALAERGVDLAGLVVRPDRPTARTTILVDAAGDRSIGSEDFGACDGFAPGAAARAALQGMAHVHSAGSTTAAPSAATWRRDTCRSRRTSA